MSEKLSSHTVTEDEAGLRLDRWFRRYFPDLGHGQLQKLLRTGQVRLGGKRAEASTRLEAGQSIRVPPQVIVTPKTQTEKQSAHETKKLQGLILYQDDDVIVLNKPAGLAVQGGTGLKENLDDMLAALARKGGHGEWLRGAQSEPISVKPKLVHRLDRETSGVLLLARTSFAAAKLAEAFRARATRKIYWGLTLGVPKPARGKIEAPLIKRGETMAVDEDNSEDAKSATTLYEVVESATGEAAFVVLWPLTGRTHQLRAHMNYIGAPLLGDPLYGTHKETALPRDELGKGLHLHARRLVIPHPRRGLIDVVAPLPPHMQKSWRWFGFDASTEAVLDDI